MGLLIRTQVSLAFSGRLSSTPAIVCRLTILWIARNESLTAHVSPGPSNSPYLSLWEWSRLPFTVRASNDRYAPPSLLIVFQGWGLIDLPLRASNEGLPRPRVARAQEIIRLHPFLCSASRRTTRLPLREIWDRKDARSKERLGHPPNNRYFESEEIRWVHAVGA